MAMIFSFFHFDGAGAQDIVLQMDMAMHVPYQSPESDKQRRYPGRAFGKGSEVACQNADLAQRACGLLVFLSHLTRQVSHGTELRDPWRSAVPGRPFEFRNCGKQNRFFLLHLQLEVAPELVDNAMQGGQERRFRTCRLRIQAMDRLIQSRQFPPQTFMIDVDDVPDQCPQSCHSPVWG